MFELEKERIKKSLLEKPNLDYQKYYKQKLEELYTLSIYCLSTKLSYITETTMLLPIYLASKHVCYSIQLLNSVVKEVMLDPVNLPYDKYIKKFEELTNDFKMAPSDIPPIYYNESEWDGYDYQRTFGDDITNLFPSFTFDIYWDDKEQVFPNYESGTFEQTIKTSLRNSTYLRKGIINHFEEIICGLYEISNYLDSRLDYSQSLKDTFRQRINDYMHSSRWVDARDEVYNEIRLLGTGKDIIQVLNNMKIQYFYHLKNNRLGTLFMQTNRVEFFIFELDDPIERATQSELNEFFKLHCQYELVCKLFDYKSKWNVKNEYDLFINKGTEYIVNSLVPYLAAKIDFNSRKSYAALWQALLDLNLLKRTEAGVFKDWLNNSFLKDAPNDSREKGK
ncbi:MAG: hypothetical protein IJE43_09885 [Alphaproteobacteria bacterium]|nr:hypothetical protein [Alphaproteobacteria bacterium]